MEQNANKNVIEEFAYAAVILRPEDAVKAKPRLYSHVPTYSLSCKPPLSFPLHALGSAARRNRDDPSA